MVLLFRWRRSDVQYEFLKDLFRQFCKNEYVIEYSATNQMLSFVQVELMINLELFYCFQSSNFVLINIDVQILQIKFDGFNDVSSWQKVFTFEYLA